MWDEFINAINSHLQEVGKDLGNWLSQHAFNIGVILFGAWIIRHFGSKIIIEALRHPLRTDLYPTQVDRDKRLKTLESLVGAFVRIGIYIVAVIMIVGELGINTCPLLA